MYHLISNILHLKCLCCLFIKCLEPLIKQTWVINNWKSSSLWSHYWPRAYSYKTFRRLFRRLTPLNDCIRRPNKRLRLLYNWAPVNGEVELEYVWKSISRFCLIYCNSILPEERKIQVVAGTPQLWNINGEIFLK